MKIIPRFSPSISLDDLVLKKSDSSIEIFQKLFCNYLGRRYCLFLPSGRSALYLILSYLKKIDKRKKVILPAFTHGSIPEVVSTLGLKVLFQDVNRETFLIDVEDLNSDILAVVPTHLFGLSCEMKKIMEISKLHNVYVIEDCAQGMGARYEGCPLGSWGYASYFSFSITKNFTTLSGGLVATDDYDLFKTGLKIIKKYNNICWEGMLKALLFIFFCEPVIFLCILYPLLFVGNKKDILELIFKERKSKSKGYSFEQSSFKASLGIRQFQKFNAVNHKRKMNGVYLRSLLSEVNSKFIIPKIAENSEPSYLSFPIAIYKRNQLKHFLLRRGIDTTFGFLQAYGDCPNAKFLENSILHLPVHHRLRESDLEYIAKSVKDFLNREV